MTALRALSAVILVGCGRIDFDPQERCTPRLAENTPYAAGAGTPDDPYRICSAAQLMNAATRVEDLAAHFIVAQDIDLAGEAFPGFGSMAAPFAGFIDGDGHAIANATVTAPLAEPAGFINAGRDARVANLTLDTVTIEGSTDVGGVIGYCLNSQLTNTTLVAAHVRGSLRVGGLIGNGVDCRVFDIALAGTVEGTGGDIGGVVGNSLSGTYVNVDSTIAVNAPTADRVGGAIGNEANNPTLLQNVNVRADVVGNNSVGGFLGWNGDGCFIYRSQFAGTIRGVEGVGGIVGTNNDVPFIVRSTAVDATVTGTSAVGGFSGNFFYAATITDSHFTGTLVGSGAAQTRFGGFAGDINYYGRVERSYVDVTIDSQAATVGGFIGSVRYWSANAALYDVTRSFAIANVTGASPTNSVSLWIGENTDPNPVVAAGSYYWSGGTCTNQGGGGCGSGGMAIADKTQFYGASAQPVAEWDFTRVWQARTDGLPTLLLDQQSAPAVDITCPTIAFADQSFECVTTIVDGDPNELHVVTHDPRGSCYWLTQTQPTPAPIVHGKPGLYAAGTCTASFRITDGTHTTATTPFTVDVHAGVAMSPAIDNRGQYYGWNSELINSGSYPVTFTLTNREPVTVTGLAITGITGDFAFPGGAFPGGGTCGSTLASGASCTVVIAYVPTVLGETTIVTDVHFAAARGPVSYRLTLRGYGR